MSTTIDPAPSGGGARPSMNDVAAAAGVSLGTVSNVLNYPDKVSETTRQRVQNAIARLGFVRNGAARSLVAGNSTSIGLVVIDLTNSLFVDIARGAQRRARAGGFNLQLANSDNQFEQQDEHLTFFDEARVSGLLLAPMEDSSDAIMRVRSHGRPVVVLNYSGPEAAYCSVVVDNDRVGHLAAAHLLGLGHRRIAFVGGRTHLQPVHDRREGVRRAVAEVGAHLEEIDTPDLNPPSGTAVARALLARSPGERPDAIIAVTDLLGMAIIGELVNGGVRVPEDVAVMGCDHNSAAWGGVVPLTSVALNGEQLGAAAIDLLQQELSTPGERHRHRQVSVEPELMVRESTQGRSPA